MEETAAKLREQTIEQWIGSQISPITSADDLIGEWDMRFAGPAGSDRVEWRYAFQPDGSVAVGDEQWQWRFNDDGTVSLIASVPADASTPGLEDGAESEEPMFPFRAADGRVVLSNDDTSLVEVLTRRGKAD